MRRRILSSSVLALTALAACGGGSDQTVLADPATTAADDPTVVSLQRAHRMIDAAALRGDVDATRALLSPRCDEVTDDEVALYLRIHADVLQGDPTDMRVSVDGDRGSTAVDYRRYGDGGTVAAMSTNSFDWVDLDGGWRVSSCEVFDDVPL